MFAPPFWRRGSSTISPISAAGEFPAIVTEAEGAPPPRDETRPLGLMLHDISFGVRNEARFFEANLAHGVLRVPEWRVE